MHFARTSMNSVVDEYQRTHLSRCSSRYLTLTCDYAQCCVVLVSETLQSTLTSSCCDAMWSWREAMGHEVKPNLGPCSRENITSLPAQPLTTLCNIPNLSSPRRAANVIIAIRHYLYSHTYQDYQVETSVTVSMGNEIARSALTGVKQISILYNLSEIKIRSNCNNITKQKWNLQKATYCNQFKYIF